MCSTRRSPRRPPRSPTGRMRSSPRWSTCPRRRATCPAPRRRSPSASTAARRAPRSSVRRARRRGRPPDLIATVRGTGERRIMLLGHVDTVIGHDAHQPLRREGERLYGTGTVDMKGGDVLAFGVARALARRPDRFAELAVLMVCDEEWRTAPFGHVERFAGYDACLCFEAGQLTARRTEGVVVKRKAAGTLRVDATGRAAHSGAAPDQGRNALLALARIADRVAAFHDLAGPEQLSVVPTVMRSGDAFNIVPAAGELICDMRARTAGGVRAGAGQRSGGARRGRARRADGAQVARDGLDRGDRAGAGGRRAPPRQADRRRAARRCLGRQPLRRLDPADDRRARPARRRGPHARRVRAARGAGVAGRGGARDRPRAVSTARRAS